MEWYIAAAPAERISLNDRGLAYGDGLFETIAVRDGQPRLFAAHLRRLQSGAERLGITPPAEQAVARLCALASGGRRLGTLKLIYTRGSGPRGYAPPPAPHPVLAAGFSAAVPAAVPPVGIAVRCCATPAAVSPALAGLKSLARLEHVLARAEWSGSEFAEGLMFDPDGNLVCGTMSNVFIVDGQALVTPQLDRSGVHGVMREHVLALAQGAGVPVREARISRAVLLAADDVFLTNSQVGLLPVARVEATSFARAELTLRIRALLAADGIAECAV